MLCRLRPTRIAPEAAARLNRASIDPGEIAFVLHDLMSTLATTRPAVAIGAALDPASDG